MKLEEPVQNDEIIQALFQIGPFKALGPDGLPAAFYQRYWRVVQPDMLATVHSFFHSDLILKYLNHSFLTLTPKSASPEDVSQFCPFRLCNVV